MSQHSHTVIVDGCYRCELSSEEMAYWADIDGFNEDEYDEYYNEYEDQRR